MRCWLRDNTNIYILSRSDEKGVVRSKGNRMKLGHVQSHPKSRKAQPAHRGVDSQVVRLQRNHGKRRAELNAHAAFFFIIPERRTTCCARSMPINKKLMPSRPLKL
eukprot:3245742-Pleurochrysis_carterae.AAC.6